MLKASWETPDHDKPCENSYVPDLANQCSEHNHAFITWKWVLRQGFKIFSKWTTLNVLWFTSLEEVFKKIGLRS